MSQDRYGLLTSAPTRARHEDIDINLKEAFGLPDALPPIRLLSLAELAAQARTGAAARPARRARRVGGQGGRRVDEAGDLSPADAAAAAARRARRRGDDFAFLWEYALAAEWLVFDDADEDRVLPGETAEDWADDTTRTCASPGPSRSAPSSARRSRWPRRSARPARTRRRPARTTTTTQDDEDDEDEGDEPDDDATGSRPSTSSGSRWRWPSCSSRPRGGRAARGVRRGALGERRRGQTAAQAARGPRGVAGGLRRPGRAAARQAGRRWPRSRRTGGSPAHPARPGRRCTTSSSRPGVEIPLLPPTAAELTGAELLAMAEGVTDAEFEAEFAAWTAARGADAAARELLELAATASRASGCSRWPRSPASAPPPSPPGGTA